MPYRTKAYQNHGKKLYKIAIKASNGNTVGFIDLSPQFTQAVLGKSSGDITAGDVLSINHGDFENYVKGLTLEVTETIPSKPRYSTAKAY